MSKKQEVKEVLGTVYYNEDNTMTVLTPCRLFYRYTFGSHSNYQKIECGSIVRVYVEQKDELGDYKVHGIDLVSEPEIY